LLVQHATTNHMLCELITGLGAQQVRYACNDMVAVDREIDETYALERYIDAQSGGPGRGWFRVVKTPAEARAVIDEGKLAVILGIETSTLFDCFLTPRPGFPDLRRGVRARRARPLSRARRARALPGAQVRQRVLRRRRRSQRRPDRQLRQQRPLVELRDSTARRCRRCSTAAT
jgi:hypothetical protein